MAVRYMSDLDIDLFKGGAGGLVIGGAPNNPMTGALWLDPDAWAVFTWWTDTDDPLWVKLFDIADPKPPPKTPPQPPGPGPGGGSGVAWEITNQLPGNIVVITGTAGNGLFPMATWTGWDPSFQADLNDQILYLGPNAPQTPAALKVRLFVQGVGAFATEVEVPFDTFGPGTSAPNHVQVWGYASPTNAIYVHGANSTSNPLNFRLVHTP